MSIQITSNEKQKTFERVNETAGDRAPRLKK